MNAGRPFSNTRRREFDLLAGSPYIVNSTGLQVDILSSLEYHWFVSIHRHFRRFNRKKSEVNMAHKIRIEKGVALPERIKKREVIGDLPLAEMALFDSISREK